MSFARVPITSSAHAKSAAQLAARAFADDPIFSWIAFHEPTRLPILEQVMGAMIAMRRPDGAYVDGLEPARGLLAIELPGRAKGTLSEWLAFAPRLARLVPTMLSVPHRRELLRRTQAGFASLEAMHDYRPREPHYYVAVLAVDPTSQRGGIGGQLLRSVLAEADAARLPAHLETARPTNVAYYERFGFELRHELREGPTPPIWIMTRPAGPH